MRTLPLVGATALGLIGLAAGLASGAAQTVDGLDLAKVRARATLSPADAERFARIVADRGAALREEAVATAAGARANGGRMAAALRAPGKATGTFDFDAMIAAAGREPALPEEAPRFVAFASLSMPEASLRQMIADVGRAGGVVAFRGFPNNSVRQFTSAIARVTGDSGSSAVGIDPRLFRAFGVEAVPTYVVTATAFDLCDGFDCTTAVPPHDRLTGNVTAGHALETFASGGGPGAGVAALYRARLNGAPQ